ncbi:MAG: bifunctional 23S rRNA (guanine(2069)-N(7))-methyltransferase RlmK/23S rRNA (guanine(2445)-N(2))-methyltransferase RlmL [Candidatus Schekmanbacteria bacterium]|nr:bifunctional 23S rRNA (guanine(2069)-N(7))-methyltransferase RlmK/23S rRNA (guanine(2445)-N(2))-methyltransferase RlmL [Candidatus Schekmanbacteria bacterium]
MTDTYFVVAPGRLGEALAAELVELGAAPLRVASAGVELEGSFALACRICLWTRIASRVLRRVGAFAVASAGELYEGARELPWETWLGVDGTLAVDCVVASGLTPGITHTDFAALRVKDAIVDRFRDRHGRRPSVNAAAPDLRVNLLLDKSRVELRIDLAGESLHRRGYRTAREAGAAPLKENVAAGLLRLAGWPERAREGAPFLDPLCGSGTLPLEAALIAADVAPGLLRAERGGFGFARWRGHDRAVWSALCAEARERAAAGRERARRMHVVGHDEDPHAVRGAIACAERAGLRGCVCFERQALSAATPPGEGPGLLVSNPPYGERLRSPDALIPLYTNLGDLLKRRFAGWEAWLLTAAEGELSRYLGLRPTRRVPVWNGDIECRLLRIPILAGSLREARERPRGGEDTAGAPPAETAAGGAAAPPEHVTANATTGATPPAKGDASVAAFINRIKKNLRLMRRWVEREGITCYRVYDADIPEYAVIVDRYERFAVVQEQAPPKTVDPGAARHRLRQVVSTLPELLAIAPEDLHLRVRRRQRGTDQYQRQDDLGVLHEVREGGHRFLVNLTDYLDTGLFLDGRATRARLAALAPGRRFLNLFAYTGAATVYVACAGAASTTSIDLSPTYLEWGRRNLELNGVAVDGRRHRLERADCQQLLAAPPSRDRYELIFLEPPTFSNSKAMRGTLDLARDQRELVLGAARLLAPGGILLFSASAHGFRLTREPLLAAGVEIVDLSAATLPPDFCRRERQHAVFQITWAAGREPRRHTV